MHHLWSSVMAQEVTPFDIALRCEGDGDFERAWPLHLTALEIHERI